MNIPCKLWLAAPSNNLITDSLGLRTKVDRLWSLHHNVILTWQRTLDFHYFTIISLLIQMDLRRAITPTPTYNRSKLTRFRKMQVYWKDLESQVKRVDATLESKIYASLCRYCHENFFAQTCLFKNIYSIIAFFLVDDKSQWGQIEKKLFASLDSK